MVIDETHNFDDDDDDDCIQQQVSMDLRNHNSMYTLFYHNQHGKQFHRIKEKFILLNPHYHHLYNGYC